MATKTKKAAQTMPQEATNPFAAAFGARLAKQVAQELTSAKKASASAKKKARGAGR